jgi:hypothetical protein
MMEKAKKLMAENPEGTLSFASEIILARGEPVSKKTRFGICLNILSDV